MQRTPLGLCVEGGAPGVGAQAGRTQAPTGAPLRPPHMTGRYCVSLSRCDSQP